MTTRYYGADIGVKMPTEVTESASTISKPMEFACVFTTAGMSKFDAMAAIDAIKRKIMTDNWPPA